MVDLSRGYELILGSSPDPQFGPVLLFGAGVGIMLRSYKESKTAPGPTPSNEDSEADR